MILSVEIPINAPRERVWEISTDIENCAKTIDGIEESEILERPGPGLLGLKWRETRTMFGKKATEVMWITEVNDLASYKVRAESHGTVYLTTISLHETNGVTTLRWDFGAIPQTFMAKVMGFTMGRLFAGSTKKMLLKDLEDIKRAAEA